MSRTRPRGPILLPLRGRPIPLAGDTAHRFPPSMGQNMDVRICDTANLAWKLAAVVDGWAGAP